MLPIPSSLLDKVKQAMQTIGNNAEPKMTIIAQKAAKFLTQGSFLNPRTVRTGNSLGPLDICIRREDYMQEPTEIVMVYIEDGLAKVATLPYVHTPDIYFTYQYTIGPATDVACDFDGRWEYIIDRTGLYFDTETVWALETFGEPYIAIINAGVLSIWQDQVQLLNLVSENVVKCSLLRGWKSINHVLTDQGVICTYIKTDGKVYYRNYAEQEDGSFIWEAEAEIIEFLPTVVNLGLFRTADYRTGFLAEINGEIQLLLTVRSWSAMASPREFLTANVSNMTVNVYEIAYLEAMEPDEHIASELTTMFILSYGDVMTTMRDAWNYDDGTGDWGKKIELRWTDTIDQITPNQSEFRIVDGLGVTYYPENVIRKEGMANHLLLQFGNINNAVNPLTVYYTPGTMTWNGSAIPGDSVQFNATNLIPYYVDPPVLVSVHSVDNQTIRLEFDKPIVQIASQAGFAFSGYEPFMSPEGDLVLTQYVTDAITLFDAYTVQATLTYAGRMKHPQGNVTLLFTGSLIGSGSSYVASFEEEFLPAGLTPWFKPNDPERLTASVSMMVVSTYEVDYLYRKAADEQLTAQLSGVTIVVTKVGSLPL